MFQTGKMYLLRSPVVCIAQLRLGDETHEMAMAIIIICLHFGAEHHINKQGFINTGSTLIKTR